MLKKLRLLLMRWLGVTDLLLEIQLLRKDNQALRKRLTVVKYQIKKDHDKMYSEYERFFHQMDLIWDVTHIGLDITPVREERYGDRSWACICLAGEKQTFMKFVDLNSSQMREIQHFLRHFEDKNIYFDAPRGFADHFWMERDRNSRRPR